MEQHPVPQHIASFQFKLFGNLTVRQFMMLAIPMTVAGVIFFSQLQPVILKYFFAGAIGLGGAFVALVPVGGRPFDKWIVAFIRAIFAPTQRIWVKETQIPEFLTVVTAGPSHDEKIPEEITEIGRERLVAYLKSLPHENQSAIDTREAMAISRLDFSGPTAGSANLPAPIIWPSDFDRKKSTVKPVFVQSDDSVSPQNYPSDVRLEEPATIAPFAEKPKAMHTQKIKKEEVHASVPQTVQNKPVAQAFTKQTVKIQQHAKPYSLQGLEDRLSAEPRKVTNSAPKTDHIEVWKRPKLRAHLASRGNFEVDNIISLIEPDNHMRFVRGVGKTRVRKLHFAPPANFDLSKLPIRGERRFEISEELKRRFNFEDDAPDVVLPNEKSVVDNKASFDAVSAGHEVSQVLPKKVPVAPVASEPRESKIEMSPAKSAQAPLADNSKFSVTDTKLHTDFQQNQGPQIIPLTSTPNVLSGLVMDASGVPIESAVLVVRDSSGIPVRALKTNKLGQFLSATPLSNGSYTVEVESDAATFKPAEFSLSGQVMSPLGLKGDVKNI